MRYLLFTLVIAVSFLSNAQHVLTNFDKVVMEQNFTLDNTYFPQKYNANELLIHENNQYLVQRISSEDFTVAYARTDKSLGSFHLSTEIELTKGKEHAGGIVVHGQAGGNGGIIIEINNQKRYRVRKLYNGQERILTGHEKDGWVKTKNLNKKGNNLIEVKTANGYYDIYFNGVYETSMFDLQFKGGLCGFFVNGGSALRSNYFKINVEGSPLVPETSDKDSTKKEVDEDFTEVILLFKTKIDQQQAEINRLQGELDKCRSMLNYDTALVSRSEELGAENDRLLFLVDSTSKALSTAKRRLEYLESFREDIESGSNGDLVLNLTTILAEIKKENAALETEVDELKEENAELKKGNDIMLKEIERLQKLLDAQTD